jgi:hypothetical protein
MRMQVAHRRARMHRVRAYSFNSDAGAGAMARSAGTSGGPGPPPAAAAGNRVYHVEWARGSPGQRATRCTLVQMIEVGACTGAGVSGLGFRV